MSGLVRIDAGTEGLGLALNVRPAWGRTAERGATAVGGRGDRGDRGEGIVQ